jgi:glycosyltransferase involved in cell wall biosynthesis
MGNVESLETILADADLFLLTSETESFGLVLLEAMSCGVPCVSTDVGGVREVLGELGGLAPLGNLERLAAAAVSILRDPAEHERQSRAARERAVSHFAREKIACQYVELWKQVARC